MGKRNDILAEQIIDESEEEEEKVGGGQRVEDVREDMIIDEIAGEKSVPQPRGPINYDHEVHGFYNQKNRIMERSDFEDDFQQIKDKLNYLINKGKRETVIKSAAEKVESNPQGEHAPPAKKFMQHVMQGQKDEFEMQNKTFLTEG